jgi:hypothetical protein
VGDGPPGSKSFIGGHRDGIGSRRKR